MMEQKNTGSDICTLIVDLQSDNTGHVAVFAGMPITQGQDPEITRMAGQTAANWIFTLQIMLALTVATVQ